MEQEKCWRCGLSGSRLSVVRLVRYDGEEIKASLCLDCGRVAHRCNDCSNLMVSSFRIRTSCYCFNCYTNMPRCCVCGHRYSQIEPCICRSNTHFPAILKPSGYKKSVSLSQGFGKKSPVMGVEIEFVGGSKTTCGELTAILKECNEGYDYCDDGFVVAKEDGSVSIEFNTDAMSLDCWNDNIGRVRSLLDRASDEGFEEHGEAGIHIHVGRQYFDGEQEQSNFYWFINLTDMYWSKIAGRNTDYATYDVRHYRDEEGMYDPDFDKYQAVNRRHISTLEVRIFRTTLDVDRLYYYLKLMHYLAVFCNTQIDGYFFKNTTDRMFEAFFGFVKQQNESVATVIYSDICDLVDYCGVDRVVGRSQRLVDRAGALDLRAAS